MCIRNLRLPLLPLLLASACAWHEPASRPASAGAAGPPTHLRIISLDDMTPSEQTMIASLQGILSRTSTTQIYVSGTEAYQLHLDVLRDDHGVAYTAASGPWSLVNEFAAHVDGYILYTVDDGDGSINAASSLAGLLNALPVTASLEASARERGLSMVADVRGRDEDWILDNYWEQLNHRLIIEAAESIPYHLRDLAAKERAMVFFDGTQDSPWRTRLMARMEDDAVVMGWGKIDGSENGFIRNSGTQGVHYIPSDWARNLSVFGGFEPRSAYRQKTHDEPEYEEDVHYVAFVISDGDNMQWTMNRGMSPRWWGNAARGEFDVGWTFPPHLMELAPTIMDWHYDTASAGPGRDNFVVGPSGMGFFFPSDYPDAELDLHLGRLDRFMAAADMSSVVVLGYDSWSEDSLWEKYLAQPHVGAVLYFEWARFGLNTHGRTIKWFHGKPLISAGGKLFERHAEFVADINQASTDVYTDDAYTVVYVHAWEPNIMDSLSLVVEQLDDDVRVVTPEELVKLVLRFRGASLE